MVSSKVPQLETIDDAEASRGRSGEIRRSGALRDQPQVRLREHDRRQPGTEADERAKLRLCVEAARAIWGG
jgi:hypothetical protein